MVGILTSTETWHEDLQAVARIEAVPRILEVACHTTGLGFAAVARVTETRWIACAVRDEIGFGLQPGGELAIKTTICDEVRDSGKLVVIDHVAEDADFRGHPAPQMYGFQSYISAPIKLPGGRFFGTLCAFDPRPARLNTPEIVSMFRLFADLIGFHLDAQDRLSRTESALMYERQHAELREQFIGVLGHDLRNPLAAIQTGARLLTAAPVGDKATRVATVIQNSAARMAGLIDNVLDFARGRLGGGLPLTCGVEEHLDTTLEQVVAELCTAWPDREIQTDIAVDRPVFCDRSRVAQLFSNLLANALTHGDPAGPVRVCARTDATGFALSVTNAGQPIPPETIERLFQPFARASDRSDQQGLGLGLYIASEIARAHGGTLTVESKVEETRFTFTIPLREEGGGKNEG